MATMGFVTESCAPSKRVAKKIVDLEAFVRDSINAMDEEQLTEYSKARKQLTEESKARMNGRGASRGTSR